MEEVSVGLSYHQRLKGFAEDKRLGRLSGRVYDPDGASCDACGSELPRTLFGLKDTVSGRCYFVGQSCLTSLLESRLVARARFRQRAQTAYRHEIERRRNGGGAGTTSVPDSREPERATPPARRTVLVTQTERECRVLVRLEDGGRTVSTRASERRSRLHWRRRGGALLLEPAERERPAALAVCLARAYGDALSRWRNDSQSMASATGSREAERC